VLTAREFELLRVLIAEPVRVFTRNELLQSVWGMGDWSRTRTLDSHASRLRRHLTMRRRLGSQRVGHRLPAY